MISAATDRPMTYKQGERIIEALLNGSGGGGGTGTNDYNALINKPTINGVALSGNISTSDLGLPSTVVSDSDIDAMWNGTYNP